MDKDSIAHDINCCIENIQSVPIYDERYEESVGRLRRALVEIDGLENIWTEDMSDFEKACIMKERGFELVAVGSKSKPGIMVKYLGYHLWDLDDQQVRMLKSNRSTENFTDLKKVLSNFQERFTETIQLVSDECNRQDSKWGKQHHSNEMWLKILLEELGEVANSMLEPELKNLELELIQCAAVLIQWITDKDRVDR